MILDVYSTFGRNMEILDGCIFEPLQGLSLANINNVSNRIQWKQINLSCCCSQATDIFCGKVCHVIQGALSNVHAHHLKLRYLLIYTFWLHFIFSQYKSTHEPPKLDYNSTYNSIWTLFFSVKPKTIFITAFYKKIWIPAIRIENIWAQVKWSSSIQFVSNI